MKVLRISTLEEAAQLSLEKIKSVQNSPDSFSIALTGGNFGKSFLTQTSKLRQDISFWKIFVTDERLTSTLINSNSSMLLNKLESCRGFNKNNINFFNPSNNTLLECLDPISKQVNSLQNKRLNFCLLSLGVDGHLAGHFKSSSPVVDDRFVYTKEAPKPNPFRISFNVSWLQKSDFVILCIKGEKKRKAFNDLMEDKGLHSGLNKKKDLLILTDLVG